MVHMNKRNSVGDLIEQRIGVFTKAAATLESATKAFRMAYSYVTQNNIDALSIEMQHGYLVITSHVPASVENEVDWSCAHEAILAKLFTALEGSEVQDDRREQAVDAAGGDAAQGSEAEGADPARG